LLIHFAAARRARLLIQYGHIRFHPLRRIPDSEYPQIVHRFLGNIARPNLCTRAAQRL
jgi:hypothetical protein